MLEGSTFLTLFVEVTLKQEPQVSMDQWSVSFKISSHEIETYC